MKGIQQGIGLMIFPNGERRAGFFNFNVFKKALNDINEFDELQNKLTSEDGGLIPKEFREELEDYLRERELSRLEEA